MSKLNMCKRKLRDTLLAAAATILICIAPLQSSYASPVLEVDINGILTGAIDVDVGGALYDVVFMHGSCTALFSGCNQPSDFTFTTGFDAMAASQALLDQVLVDGVLGQFDSDPTKTRGCSDASGLCEVLTPYSVGAYVDTVAAINNDLSNADVIGAPAFDPNVPPSLFDIRPYAIWTPVSVPEPQTFFLLITGLAWIASFSRRGCKTG